MDVASSVVCVSVLDTPANPAKTAELIPMPFCRGGSCGFEESHISWGAYWHHLARKLLNDPCAAAMRPYVSLL